jgi:hypothetical protein
MGANGNACASNTRGQFGSAVASQALDAESGNNQSRAQHALVVGGQALISLEVGKAERVAKRPTARR